MTSIAGKITRDNPRSAGPVQAQHSRGPLPGLTDKRTAVIAQRRLQDMIDSSPRMAQLRSVQEMADHSGGAARSLPAASRTADTPVVQAKKTAHFDLPKRTAARVGFKYSDYKDLVPADYRAYVYNKLEETYNAKLTAGTRYWNQLKDALDSYRAEDNSEFLEQQAEKAKDYDKKFAKNYTSKAKVNKQDNRLTGVDTSGRPIKRRFKLKRDTEKKIPYTNVMDFSDYSISAKFNYATKDKARISDDDNKNKAGYKKRGLNNSEILWQQYKLAAGKRAKNSSEKADLISRLNAIKRRQVQTPDTLRTLLFAMPDGKDDVTSAHSWQPEGEEFRAVLGTANCSGTAFLLADHVAELNGKSIASIDLLGGNDVNIDIGLTPGDNAV